MDDKKIIYVVRKERKEKTKSFGKRKINNLVELKNYLWARIDVKGKDDCWFWKKGLNSNGYGVFVYRRKSFLAHRVIYMLVNEITLSPRELVCHKCDNTGCCNPNHLFVGTAKDNMIDAKNKGRLSGRNPIISFSLWDLG